MKLIMAGDILEGVVATIMQALPYSEEAVLRGILSEAIPKRGMVIEATKGELSNMEGNLLYKEVEVIAKKKGGAS